MCCTWLAGNAGPKKLPKMRHLGTIAQICRAISSQIRHVSTIGKKLLNSNTSSTCPGNTVNFGPLAAEICWRVWGTPAHFNGFRVLAALLHNIVVAGVSQTLRRWTEGTNYIWQGGHHVGHWPTFLVSLIFAQNDRKKFQTCPMLQHLVYQHALQHLWLVQFYVCQHHINLCEVSFTLTYQGPSYIWGNRGGRLGCFQDCCLSENNITSTIFSKRELTFTFAVHVRYLLSPVRLSVVCNVRAPYSGGSNSPQYYFYAIRYLDPSIDIHWKFHGDRPRGTPPLGELNTRGVAKYSDFGPIDGYISETVEDRR